MKVFDGNFVVLCAKVFDGIFVLCAKVFDGILLLCTKVFDSILYCVQRCLMAFFIVYKGV